MAHLPLANFKGELPRLEARALPPEFAAISKNTTFENGMITPLRQAKIENVFGADYNSMYLFGTTWLGWTNLVDVARAPVAADRIYYTGDGVPKVRDGSTVYNLALAAPTGAPTLTNLSTPDDAFLEDVYYAYTYVTSLGEESQPSPLSALLSTSPGVTVRVTSFTAAPGGRGITSIRLYRSKTSAAGVTALFFVTEFTTATTTYDHALASTPLQEVIPSTDYDPPPATLAGLVSMPNGMMAAFNGNDVYFSEPYVPHAWPEKYVLTVDYPVVGLATFGSNVAVMTTGTPYLMQGTHPENMVSDKMEKAMPCLSRRGIVDIGYAALYPSSEGLAMITGNDAKIITKGIFTREQWLQFVPSSMVAERFKGKYLFLRVTTPDNVYNGGAPTFYSPGTFDQLLGNGVTLPSGTITIAGGTPDSSFGAQKLGIIDFEGEAPYFIETDIEAPKAMISDETSADLFVLRPDSRTVVAWEDVSSPYSTYLWRSKIFSGFVPVHYGAVYARTSRPLITEDAFSIRIYGDGELAATITSANQPERLPAFGYAREWEVEIESNVPLVTFQMASTIDELTQGGG